jgi:sulfur relay (sulfurtransferase) DsrC/TusE family protein
MNNQLRMGIKVESEHKKTISFIKNFHKKYHKFPSNNQIFKKISSDHILEDKKYYTKLKKARL